MKTDGINIIWVKDGRKLTPSEISGKTIAQLAKEFGKPELLIVWAEEKDENEKSKERKGKSLFPLVMQHLSNLK
jgi:hypothetical protein